MTESDEKVKNQCLDTFTMMVIRDELTKYVEDKTAKDSSGFIDKLNGRLLSELKASSNKSWGKVKEIVEAVK